MQAKVEVGNRSIVQLGPTIQFNPCNYQENPKLQKPFLFAAFCDNGGGGWPVLFRGMQAEEGARFFYESHQHLILELPVGEELALPVDYRWLSCDQLRLFLNFGESVNSCARSIISCLL
jgi:oxidase EvaA